jgi:phenylalanyl-tRNA synthetase alpha chain
VLNTHSVIHDSLEISAQFGIPHPELDKILKSLLSDDYITLASIEKKSIELTAEGKNYAEKGTPEFQYTSALKLNEPTLKGDVEAIVGKDIAKIGFSKAMQKKWIELSKENKELVTRKVEHLDD